MEKTFEERKQAVIDYCREMYTNKPSGFWQSNKVEYKTTLELVPQLDDYIQTSGFYFIKKNMGLIKLNVVGILLFGIYGYWLVSQQESKLFVFIFIGIFVLITALAINGGLDRKAKIIFTPKDFWVYSMQEPIAWKHLITSYIKFEHSDEDANAILLVHYYDERSDTFTTIQFLIAGLEMTYEDVSFHIEKFRQENTKNKFNG